MRHWLESEAVPRLPEMTRDRPRVGTTDSSRRFGRWPEVAMEAAAAEDAVEAARAAEAAAAEAPPRRESGAG